MDDDELGQLRAKRLQELQQQQQRNTGSKEREQAVAEQKSREEEIKNQILSQVLTQEARSRLSTICLAKPENGRLLENRIVAMARFGQITSKLDDKEFVQLVQQLNQHTQQKTPSVKFDRRRAELDSDEEF